MALTGLRTFVFVLPTVGRATAKFLSQFSWAVTVPFPDIL